MDLLQCYIYVERWTYGLRWRAQTDIRLHLYYSLSYPQGNTCINIFIDREISFSPAAKLSTMLPLQESSIYPIFIDTRRAQGLPILKIVAVTQKHRSSNDKPSAFSNDLCCEYNFAPGQWVHAKI